MIVGGPNPVILQVYGALLHGLRLLPVAVLSPFLGGPMIPGVVRVALALGLGGVVYAAAGAPQIPAGQPLDLLAAAGRELALGAALGLVASIPLEAARAGGRIVDTLRGATLSELHVAPVRQSETAVGDLLAQWSIVLAAWVGGGRLVLSAVFSTFQVLPAGASFPRERVLEAALQGSGELLASAVCMGAPAAAGVLAADLALALANRAAPPLSLTSTAQPARAALGLFAVAAGAAVLAGKLVSLVALSSVLIRAISGQGSPR